MIVFTPWRRFSAVKDRMAIRRYLQAVADETENVLRDEMVSGRKSGRVYRRRGRSHRASAPGEYPARDSGRLFRSIKKRVTLHDATVGTTVFYAKFLADGTSKMAKRKMSEDAMKKALARIRGRVFRWVRWKIG